MKYTLIAAGVAVVLVGGFLVLRHQSVVETLIGTLSPSPKVTASRTPTSTVTPTPVPTSTPRPTPTVLPVSPTPGVIVQEHKAYTVTIQNLAYSPTPLTVQQGDVVTFKNLDTLTHTVTAFNLQFDSKNIWSGGQWTLITANLAPGTYDYHCTLHPSMRGTLIIQ